MPFGADSFPMAVWCCVYSTEVNGVGQECPTHTSAALEHAGVVLLQMNLGGGFIGLLVGLGAFGQVVVLFAVAADLMVERDFFGLEMGGLARG